MATRRKSSPGMRLRLGASVLSAARLVDTRLVKERLGRFEEMHRTYAAAQRKADAVEEELAAVQARVAACDAVQDQAVEALAAALAGEGHARRNPFETFGAPSPSVIMRLPFTEEPAAVRQLVAAIEGSRTVSVSKATLAAAHAADKAARAVEETVGPLAKLEDAVRHARRTRDSVVPGWESALAALRRGARVAADEGATDLYARALRVGGPRYPQEQTGGGAGAAGHAGTQGGIGRVDERAGRAATEVARPGALGHPRPPITGRTSRTARSTDTALLHPLSGKPRLQPRR